MTDDRSDMKPRVLIVYYSHTEQAKRVCDAMAEVLRGRGCDVSQAPIEFTDPHYAKNFKQFPFRHAVFSIVPLLWQVAPTREPPPSEEGLYFVYDRSIDIRPPSNVVTPECLP